MDWFLYDNGVRHEELNKSGTVSLKINFSQDLKPNWLRNFNDSVADKTNYFATANNTIIPFVSEEPIKFVYCDYETFSHEIFKNDLMSKTVDKECRLLKTRERVHKYT